LRSLEETLSAVRVISRKKIKEAADIHPEAMAALDAWYRITKKATWKNLADIRRTLASADVFQRCTIFNIKGNKYRLMAWVNYQTQKVFIRSVLTHADYTKERWKSDCISR
jgi:mRNA interferase HigB